MRVLVLHSELGVLRGGGETLTRSLFTAFAERGHRVAAAFIADPRGRYPIPLPLSIEPIPIPGWWSRQLGQGILSFIGRHIPLGNRFRATWDWAQEAISWRTIRWHSGRFQRRVEGKFSGRWGDFDAVYVHGDAVLASKVAVHRPTVLMLPGPVTAEAAPMLRTVHAVCATGDALVRVRTFLGDHAIDLPYGVDCQLFKPGPASVRSDLGWTEQDRVIGYAGRLTHLKGVDLLAAAFHELSRSVPNARLLIIGSGEEEESIRRALAKEMARGVAHIEPGMSQEQVSNWYRSMDVLVMPSRYEAFSLAVLEAMACGIPFLGSDVGGNTMLAETGAGWLFEPESVSSLITCLGKILKRSPELKARGKIGFEYVQRHHSWTATAERLERIYASLLGAQL
jgi:glycosyltransferase involved in cell wall biosynthesis